MQGSSGNCPLREDGSPGSEMRRKRPMSDATKLIEQEAREVYPHLIDYVTQLVVRVKET